MRRSTVPILTCLVSSTLLLVGCQAVGLRFLNLIGLEKHPLSVALVADRPAQAAEAMNPFSAYRPFQTALADDLGRPVAVDVCFPFQVQSELTSGWYDVAIVTPTQYANFAHPNAFRVLAVAVDKQGQAARRALLVVAAEASIEQIADLRGKVVAFGPVDDARMDRAAQLLLRDAGLKPTDLARELLPVPGALKHLPDSRSVALDVIRGGAAAGFIDEADWPLFPGHATQAGEPGRDQLRVIGQTEALPTHLVLASARLDVGTVEHLRAFLLSVGRVRPAVMEPLPSSGYAQPDESILAACRRLGQMPEPPSPAESEPTTAPSAGAG